MCRVRWFLGSILVVSLASPTTAAEPPAARVGVGEGCLAASADQGRSWRVLHLADALPPQCHLRAAAGACLVEFPEGRLLLGNDARVECDFARRRVKVQAGRAFLKTAPKNGWTVLADGSGVNVKAGTSVEVSVGAGRQVAVAVLDGAAIVGHSGAAPLTMAAKTRFAWRPGGKRPVFSPLSAEEQKRIETWTRPPKPALGLGQLVVTDAQWKSTVRLDVTRYHANVVLHPPLALVQLDQSFYNPHLAQEEGTFVFNLPPGASVSRFAMYVTPRDLVEGEMVERKRANEVYGSIVRSMRDPAILEQIGTNLFKMRVFPIPPRDTKRILLDYTVPLESDDGQYHFAMPLFYDLNPIADFRLSGTIRGQTALGSVASWSNPGLRFNPRPAEIAFGWSEMNFRPQADFSLSFAQPTVSQPKLRSYTADPLPQSGTPQQSSSEAQDPLAGKPITYFEAAIPAERRAPRRPQPTWSSWPTLRPRRRKRWSERQYEWSPTTCRPGAVFAWPAWTRASAGWASAWPHPTAKKRRACWTALGGSSRWEVSISWPGCNRH